MGGPISGQTFRLGLSLLLRPREVEASLWRRLRLNQDLSCRQKLFELHVSLARAIARGEYRRRPAYGLERSDFEQLAHQGLIEAIDRFDPLNGAPFEAYARPRIRGAIADGLLRSSEGAAFYGARRRAERERLRSLREGQSQSDPLEVLRELTMGLAIGLLVEGAAKIIEAEASPELDAYESLAWRELQLNLKRELDALEEKERAILVQHYVHGVEFTQIATLLGLSRGRISQIHRTALLRLRERMRYKD